MARRVLLIDYESHSVERVRGVLREPDYEVVAAHDGEEALSTFSASRFDVVLLSGMLPRLPSAEVIREIRRRGGPTAPPILLMVSGYKGTNPKADAQRVGAFDLLPRPFSDDSLREAVTGAILATAALAKPAPSASLTASLTASDIFSDILEEVAREAAPAPHPARSATATEDEVERRLRDTLSGVLPKASAPPPKPAARSSTDADVEKLLTQTLSGIRTGPRPRPAPPAAASKPEAPASAPAAARPPAPEPLSPAAQADRFGQYEILERISSGGMAELFRARLSGAQGFRKTVAIKKILPNIARDEEFLAMFADEANLAAQLSHPNIVHIFDLGKIESGGYFIAMEFVEGKDLRSILHLARETGLAMPIPLTVSIAAKVASALDYAHRRRGDDGRDLHIVHRDVSPPNILVSTDGDVKLCDFGIAKAASKVSRTESGALKGKLPYMSPEQAWGRPVDLTSDIYSLGSVLFEMLTGRKLFPGDSEMVVLEKVRAGEVVAPSTINRDVPPALDAVILKALAREPGGRYAAASEMLRDLEAVLRSYEPAPSSAELAVYVRHLEEEDAARREARAREAALPPPEVALETPAPVAPPPAAGDIAPAEAPREIREKPPSEKAAKKPAPPKPAVPPPPEPPVPASVPSEEKPVPAPVFGSTLAEAFPEAERKKRTGLYAMIAAAVVILAAGIFLVLRKPAPTAGPLPVPTPAPATPVAAVAEPTPEPILLVPDEKTIQEEAQRQLAIRRKEMQKSAAATTLAPAARPTASRSVPQAVAPTAAPPPVEPSPEPKVAEAPPKPEPTAVPVEPSPVSPPPAPARQEAPEVSRGDLVGPGPGVVEPVLISSPRVSYPPAVRQQIVPGKVVVLVLVDEDGAVAGARLQKGVSSRLVNDAVLQAVRESKFQAATKNGIPVKMWRTIVIDVRP